MEPSPSSKGFTRPSVEATHSWTFHATARWRTWAGAEIGLSFVWVDRNGREESLGAPPGNYSFPRIAPDGTRVVVDDQDLWVWSFARETMTRLTFEPGGHGFPVWTPDSQRIVYT